MVCEASIRLHGKHQLPVSWGLSRSAWDEAVRWEEATVAAPRQGEQMGIAAGQSVILYTALVARLLFRNTRTDTAPKLMQIDKKSSVQCEMDLVPAGLVWPAFHRKASWRDKHKATSFTAGCSSMIFKVPLKRSHSMMLWSGGEQELLAEHPVSQAKPNCLYPSSCLEMKYAPAFRQVKCLNQPHLSRVGIFCWGEKH